MELFSIKIRCTFQLVSTKMDALGLPDRTFIDVNHYPEAMEFLVKNGLATDSEYKRRSGFVEYPMAMLNLPLLYQHNPQIFQKANIELFGEEGL